MKSFRILPIALIGVAPILLPAVASAQATIADYQRSMGLRDKYADLTTGTADAPRWIEQTNRFYYRRTVKGGHEWMLVDGATRAKVPAFDHEKLAAAISTAASRKATAVSLPFTNFTFVDGGRAIEFTLTAPGTGTGGGGAAAGRGGPGTDVPPWRCSLDNYSCREQQPRAGRGGAGRGGRGGGGGLAGPVRPEFDINDNEPRRSPDGKMEALVRNYNIAVREVGKRDLTFLSNDGSEGGYFDPDSMAWSPDSQKLVLYKVRPGHRRFVHFVQSSPEDQLQPKHSTMQYAKPGDVLDVEVPVLFHVGTKKRLDVDTTLFPNAYDVSRPNWKKDSSAATFEYNQRGHQVFRVIEIDGTTGKTRAIISEEPKTFFTYSSKKFRQDIEETNEVIWMSERDGWNHLYLYDSRTGAVKNQITRGEWPVRAVVSVDEKARQVYFSASGMYPGKDPYFVHYYRINLDGTGLTTLTPDEGNHSASFSPDRSILVDTYSRVDMPPVTELRSAKDGALLATLETGDITALKAAGWKAPEVFTAKGRDGKTDIWGLIYRPANFDPRKKYPVVENIYAGPHSNHVPKSFGAYNQMQAQAEIGFIVVQIDGMGTSNRSKTFHDVAWQNLKDAGFPDRIAWHKAAAARYPYYDITRVGIYGTSAGGQNSLGALLFHPDFYKAAVSAAGCHDNRMDKIWWNEQWMGTVGDHYADSSNVVHASKLQGKLMLVVGEMDNNVDPASTYQVVDKLIKSNKEFDLLVIPGALHTNGGAYGEHKRNDFFARHLLGVTPPEWKAIEDATKKSTTSAAVR
ncbi:MAG TPA: DPP IV N-terminal domain-containing protein [Vicinamibacterales bacterium]|nr:DPP IV N-terminal domain-containing protein [Vicinamibacterales bacterium]